jgi:hypothetical protein
LRTGVLATDKHGCVAPSGGKGRLDESGGLRRAEQEALDRLATERAQKRQLVRGLDAFGDDEQSECGAKRDDRPCDRCLGVVGVDRGGEEPVEFQRGKWEASQGGKRRVAGAEVIEDEGKVLPARESRAVRVVRRAACRQA